MGSLGRIGTMAGWTVLRTFRSAGDLVWMVVMPVGLGLVLSAVLAGIAAVQPPQAVVVNEDGTALAGRLIDALAATPFNVSIVGQDEARAQLARGEVQAALVVPAGFSQSLEAGGPRLEILLAPDASGGLLAARAKAIATALVRGENLPGPFISIETPRGEPHDHTFTRVRILFGIYLLFALTVLIGRAGALHRERKAGLLQRTVGTGVPYGEVIVGYAASLMLIGLLQAVVVLAITGWLGIPWLAAGPGAILLPVMGSLFTGSGIAMALAGFARSESQVQLIAGGAPSLLAMLGGAFMPLELAPPGVQKLAVLNPFYWAMEALEGGFVYQGWESQTGPLAVLLLMGMVGMVAGVQALRRRTA